MLHLSLKALKQIDVVRAEGRIDSSNADEFDTAMKSLQERGRHKLVLDMEKLEYISSSALRSMVAALKTARKNQGDIVLVQVGDKIKDTLSLVGFQSLFVTYDDILDAVDAF